MTTQRSFLPIIIFATPLAFVVILLNTGVVTLPKGYTTYSGETFPLSFDYPRGWTISTDKANDVVINEEIDSPQYWLAVSIVERDKFLQGDETLQDYAFRQVIENGEEWLAGARYAQQNDSLSETGFITLQIGEEESEVNVNSANFLSPAQLPRHVRFPDSDREWFITSYNAYLGDPLSFFKINSFRFQATSEYKGDLLVIWSSCQTGTFEDCENLLYHTAKSIAAD